MVTKETGVQETKVIGEFCPKWPCEQRLVGDGGRDTEQEPLWGLNLGRKLNLSLWVGTAQESQAPGSSKRKVQCRCEGRESISELRLT